MKQSISQSKYRKNMMSGLSSRNILGHLILLKKKKTHMFHPLEDLKDSGKLSIFNEMFDGLSCSEVAATGPASLLCLCCGWYSSDCTI